MAPNDSSTFPVGQDIRILSGPHPGAVDPPQPIDLEFGSLDQELIAKDAFETKVRAFILSLEPAEQLAMWRLFHGMHPRLVLAPPAASSAMSRPASGVTDDILGPSEGAAWAALLGYPLGIIAGAAGWCYGGGAFGNVPWGEISKDTVSRMKSGGI